MGRGLGGPLAPGKEPSARPSAPNTTRTGSPPPGTAEVDAPYQKEGKNVGFRRTANEASYSAGALDLFFLRVTSSSPIRPGLFLPQMIWAREPTCGAARRRQPGTKCAHGRPVPPIRLAALPGPRPDFAGGSRPTEGQRDCPRPGKAGPVDARHPPSRRPPDAVALRTAGTPANRRARHRLRSRTAPEASGPEPDRSLAPASRPPTGLRGPGFEDPDSEDPDSEDEEDRGAVRRPAAEPSEKAGGPRAPPPRPPGSSSRLRRETVACRRPVLMTGRRSNEATASDEVHGEETGRGRAAATDRPAR